MAHWLPNQTYFAPQHAHTASCVIVVLLDALYDLVPCQAQQFYMRMYTGIALLQNAFALTLLLMRPA